MWVDGVCEVGEGGAGVVAVYMCVCVIIRIMCPRFDGDRT